MSSMHELQNFVARSIESYELVREFAVWKRGRRTLGDPALQKQVLEFLPTAAAQNYLFAADQCGKIVAMAIAGPTNKPGGLHCFHHDGVQLYCHFTLVHPQWRFMGKGLKALEHMLTQAHALYPQCETLCYWRNGAYRERPFKSGEVTWVGRRSAMVEKQP